MKVMTVAGPVAAGSTLAGLSVSALSLASAIYVVSRRTWFDYDPTSSVTPDNLEVFAPTSGAGRYFRRSAGARSWLSQSAWFIDPVNGNDDYDGSAATAVGGSSLVGPIKTEAERQRRWGTVALLTIAVTITYVRDLPVTDPLNGEVHLGYGGGLTLVGTPSVVRSGTFSAVTALNRATNQPLHVTDGSIDWTADIKRQVYISSGARIGARAFCAKAVSAGIGRLSNMVLSVIADTANSPTPVTPVATDPYDTRTLPQVWVGNFKVRGANVTTAGGPTFGAIDVNFKGSNGLKGYFEVINSIGVMVGCWFDLLRLSFDRQVKLNGCQYTTAPCAGGFILAGVAYGTGGVFNDMRAAQTVNYYDYDFLGQNGAGIYVTTWGHANVGNACTFDSVSDGMVLQTFSRVAIRPVLSGGSTFWGTNNAGRAINMEASCELSYAAAAVLQCNAGLGLGRELLCAGNDYLLAELPNPELPRVSRI